MRTWFNCYCLLDLVDISRSIQFDKSVFFQYVLFLSCSVFARFSCESDFVYCNTNNMNNTTNMVPYLSYCRILFMKLSPNCHVLAGNRNTRSIRPNMSWFGLIKLVKWNGRFFCVCESFFNHWINSFGEKWNIHDVELTDKKSLNILSFKSM